MSPRPSNKEAIVTATMKVVNERGVNGATIRQIAAEAGLTEGAIYRHFADKETLCFEIYSRHVLEMIAEKERIAAAADPIEDRLVAWVRATYEHFDRHSDAFTYVLLTEHRFPPERADITTRQGRVFERMLAREQRRKTVRPMPPALALSLFTGLLLSIPHAINAGTLKGPAARHIKPVGDAVRRLFMRTDV